MKRMFGPLPSAEDAAKDVAEWLTRLGIVIPEARPVCIRWNRDGTSTDLDEDAVAAMTDDEQDDFDGVIFTPEMPDMDLLAIQLVHMARERPERYPHRWSWRRWKLTGKVAGFLYTSGITSSGGSVCASGGDPVGGWVYSLPSWRSLSWRRRRPYLLFRHRGPDYGY